MIAEDFNFRFIGEFGGSGTEGPTRINDAWINYTGFAPFTLQLGAFTPSANLDDATSQEELLFPERSDARGALAQRWAARTGASASRCAAAASAG